ncbi:MAG: hypothetical protein RLZZ253_3390, partial [Verrucomicrobiota bacterium]
VLLMDKASQGLFALRPGNGGDGFTAGGDGGSVSLVTLAAPFSTVQIGDAGDPPAGNGGSLNGNLGAIAGNGGSISNVTGKAGVLSLIAGSGGDANSAPSGGTGGPGGNISAVTVTVTQFLQQARSGSGGDGSAASGFGGNAGNIMNVTVTGDIGNFSQSFGTAPNRMGGLLSGLGGTGSSMGVTGFMDSVKATRIAAIYAGDNSTAANALTFINRVNSIAKITANAIGADLDQDGTFDFIWPSAPPNCPNLRSCRFSADQTSP